MASISDKLIPLLLVGLSLVMNLGTLIAEEPQNSALHAAIISGGAFWFIYLMKKNDSGKPTKLN